MEQPRKRYEITKLSPKAKLALRALASGAARTNKDAAAVAQIHPAYIPRLKNSEPGRAFMAQQDEMLDKAAANLSGFIRAISAEATVRMTQLMRNASSEAIQFRAAQDLMDRNPDLSKVQKHQVDSVSIDGKDAQRLAEALVAASSVRREYKALAEGNYIKVSTEGKGYELPGPAGDSGEAGVLEGDVGGV
jgi:hypothetical protein